ncbi:MAG: AMP-binding protein [Candidatus Nanopelagicaceae bacterium]|nr:AMP-binding protein [Candidatus Nanopelagicaceae bacterium]
MDTKSQREVRLIDGAWSITQIMASLAKALSADGPALGFGSVKSQSIDGKVAVLVATTGSTGPSREIGLSAAALIASAKASNNYLQAKFGETWSLLLPLTHVAAVNVLVRSLELGTIPVDLTLSEGDYPKVDYTAIVPTQLHNSLNGDDRLLKHLQSAKAVLVGGAALNQNVAGQAKAAGINVVTTYGSSETCGGCVYNGVPLPGVKISVSDSGLIKIGGPTLASNLMLDADGFYLTSDLGEFDGQTLTVKGRSDDVIITGGENISLSEIEAVISESFAGTEFAAYAIASEKWGQELQLASVNAPSDFEERVSHLLTREFGNAAKPKRFIQLTALPLIGIGKVDRNALAQIAMKSES